MLEYIIVNSFTDCYNGPFENVMVTTTKAPWWLHMWCAETCWRNDKLWRIHSAPRRILCLRNCIQKSRRKRKTREHQVSLVRSLLMTLTGSGRDLLKILFLHLNINERPMPITIDYNNIKWHLEPFSSWNLSILQWLKIQKLRKTMEEVQKSNGTKCDTPLSEPIKLITKCCWV
jgi:hypothetical protein